MHYEESRETTLVQRCDQCRNPFRQGCKKYYCHDRVKSVCDKCHKKKCKQCQKPRSNLIEVFKCSNNRCTKRYDKDDMFYDFKGNFYICPRCLVKDYNYYYQIAIKKGSKPKQVKLQTRSLYSYQDLMAYFKQWCFSCANRIGENDAFEMQKGARICSSCISVNVDVLANMIKCVLCDGYIRNEKEIQEMVGDQTEVMCVYCAETQKQQLSQVLSNQKSKIRTTQLPSPVLRAKKPLLSAFEKSKAQIEKSRIEKPEEISKIKTMNSRQHELMDIPISIQFWGICQQCDVCSAFVEKSSIFVLKKSDPKVTQSYLKLFNPHQDKLTICLVCFGSSFTDRGQTIQFQTPPSKGQRSEEETHSQPIDSKNELFKNFAKK